MKKTLLLMALASIALGAGYVKASKTHAGASPVTATAPTSSTAIDLSVHLQLNNATGVTVSAFTVDDTKTFGGAGYLDNYDNLSASKKWAYAPDTRLSFANCAGKNSCSWDVRLDQRSPRATTWIPNGVTISAGAAGLIVYMEASTP